MKSRLIPDTTNDSTSELMKGSTSASSSSDLKYEWSRSKFHLQLNKVDYGFCLKWFYTIGYKYTMLSSWQYNSSRYTKWDAKKIKITETELLYNWQKMNLTRYLFLYLGTQLAPLSGKMWPMWRRCQHLGLQKEDNYIPSSSHYNQWLWWV